MIPRAIAIIDGYTMMKLGGNMHTSFGTDEHASIDPGMRKVA
jgi:hypothetical protein